LPNLTVISYPKSAAFLIYKGEFSPADDIVNVSVMIPITHHGCYMVPANAAAIIPQCRQQHQEKRFILDGISLLTAGAALGLGTRNAIEIKKLQTRMKYMKQTVQIQMLSFCHV
ncbi:unnamed protein product, partial [Didymodactylos carnosus]